MNLHFELLFVTLVLHLICILCNCNIKDAHGVTQLIRAARAGDEAIVNKILPACDKNVQDGSGQTALIAAIRNGHVSIAINILQSGAEVNVVDNERMSALICACGRGFEILVKLLLNRNAALKLLDQDGWSALTHAANNGHAAVVQLLIAAKMDVNGRVLSTGDTSIFYAVINNHYEVVEIMLRANASISKANRDGHTPFTFACENGYLSLVKLLVSHGADVNAVNKKTGESPLVTAFGHPVVMQLLLLQGAAVNYKQKQRGGATALILATRRNHSEAVDLLLRWPETDLSATQLTENFVPMTALQVAMTFGSNAEIVTMLKDSKSS